MTIRYYHLLCETGVDSPLSPTYPLHCPQRSTVTNKGKPTRRGKKVGEKRSFYEKDF